MYQKVSTNLNFVEREKETKKFWEDHDIFRKSMENRKEGPTYTFYDGPPTANGKPHIGHVLTRVIKDMIPRYRTMKGYMVPRKAGWDTHGLPVELEVEKLLGLNGKEQIEEYGMEPFIKKCKESVWKYKGMWEDFSGTVGFWADMDNPYVTYDDNFIESEWWALKEIWNKGLLYKGFKIVPYCPRCGTPLSTAEVSQGYKTVKERSAIVRFKAVGEDAYFLAWTTTPWTLPSNVALCMNPDETYVKVKAADGYTYYMAQALLDTVLGRLATEDKPAYEILESYKGKDLEHNQNHVIISLATSDYLHSRIDIEYDYQLSGVDDEWVRTHNPQIQYANLNPGTYTLRIKEVGQTEVERTLVIHVASPWYDTWWAWLGYLSVLVIITVWQIRTRRNKQAMKLALEREIFVKEKNDESNREKLVFFTNISHEFRTPITLIANYTDKLINDTKDYPSIHRTIVKLRRNTLKLNSLVTELLDFRRFTQDQFMLRMGRADICLFIRNIYSSFADYAKTKQISYKFTANFDEITCWFDAVQLEKVFYNILSNAFKFTNEHGKIDVSVKQLYQNVVVTISDSGVGISKEDLKRIFDRFYQSDNGLIMKGSTGIGLALTKTIVEKHHGEIEVFSEKDKGSTFVVTLPYDRNVYENVAFALKVIGASTATIKKKVPKMLSMVGLAAKYKSKPKELSGGEQQRVAIARALVNEPNFLRLLPKLKAVL